MELLVGNPTNNARRTRCTFQMLGGICPKSCNIDKPVHYCAIHMNRQAYPKCINAECNRGTYSRSGLCRLCGQSNALNIERRAASEKIKYHCDICNIDVAGIKNHLKCKKHIYRATVYGACRNADLIDFNDWIDMMNVIRSNTFKYV
jgi:hypothetical protein